MSISEGMKAGLTGWFTVLFSWVPNRLKFTLFPLPQGMYLLLKKKSSTAVYLKARKGDWEKQVHAYCNKNPLTGSPLSRKQPDEYNAPFFHRNGRSELTVGKLKPLQKCEDGRTLGWMAGL